MFIFLLVKAKISDEPAQDFLAVPDGALRRVAVWIAPGALIQPRFDKSGVRESEKFGEGAGYRASIVDQ